MDPILLCQIDFVGTSILLDLLLMLWSKIVNIHMVPIFSDNLLLCIVRFA